MTRIKRPAFAAAAAALLAVSLTACGGGAPTDASVDDFCEAFNDFPTDVDPDEDAEGTVDAVHEYADNLEEVGTPEDMPDDARSGFEAVVEALGDVDEDDVKDEDFDPLSEAEKEDAEALETYVTENC